MFPVSYKTAFINSNQKNAMSPERFVYFLFKRIYTRVSEITKRA